MHKVGRIDTNVIKNSQFKWVDKTCDLVAKCLRFLWHGQKYRLLQETAEQLNEKLLTPQLFSETRSTNYKYDVLIKFLRNFTIIVTTLEEYQRRYCNGNAAQRENSSTAARIRGKIVNSKTIHRLTGILVKTTTFLS